jgi:hypothetical protein
VVAFRVRSKATIRQLPCNHPICFGLHLFSYSISTIEFRISFWVVTYRTDLQNLPNILPHLFGVGFLCYLLSRQNGRGGVCFQEAFLLTKFIKFTLLLLGICVLSAASVFADQTTTFTFAPPPPTGVLNLGNSATFTSTGAFPGVTLGASGWIFPTTGVGNPTPLSAKNVGADEVGLGLFLGFDREISSIPNHTSMLTGVQLNIGSMLTSLRSMLPPGGKVEDVTFIFNSVGIGHPANTGDFWVVSGTNTAGAPGPNPPGAVSGISNSGSFTLPNPDAFTFFNVRPGLGTNVNSSILLNSVVVDTESPVSTPEPSSAGLLLIGFGVLVCAGTLGKKLVA